VCSCVLQGARIIGSRVSDARYSVYVLYKYTSTNINAEELRFVSNGLRARQAGVYKQVRTHQQARSSYHARRAADDR
jgi:hypothetical protein